MKKMNSLTFVMAAAVLIGANLPVGASEMDERIESSFKKSYVYTTYLAADAIEAEAVDGVVTLSGTVAEESHKTMAQETVASLPGVDRVVNELVTTAEASIEKSDTWIGRKVKLALLFHRNVDGGKTVVDVKDGVVTLTGEVSSLAQKELTTEYAKDIDGVTEVMNQMTVVAAQKAAEPVAGAQIDDASVTAQVKTALSTHYSTSALTTGVVTQDGTVTLTGISKNAAEKSLVTKLVTDIQGVTKVKNDMTFKKIETL